MSKLTYSEKLQDPRWQRKRLEVLQRENFTCQECKSKTETLHVHHRYYVSHRFPWDYPEFCFQVLCSKCHTEIKEKAEHIKMCIDEGSTESLIEDWEVGLNHFGIEIYEMVFLHAFEKKPQV